MFGKKKEVINTTSYDRVYEQMREEYSQTIRDMKESFINMVNVRFLGSIYNDYSQSSPWDKDNKYAETFQALLDIATHRYQIIKKYFDDYHTEMKKCADWDKTLKTPDEYVLGWMRKLWERKI